MPCAPHMRCRAVLRGALRCSACEPAARNLATPAAPPTLSPAARTTRSPFSATTACCSSQRACLPVACLLPQRRSKCSPPPRKSYACMALMHMCAWLRQPAPAAAAPLRVRTTASGIPGKQAGALKLALMGATTEPARAQTAPHALWLGAPTTPAGSCPGEHAASPGWKRPAQRALQRSVRSCTWHFHNREAAIADR